MNSTEKALLSARARSLKFHAEQRRAAAEVNEYAYRLNAFCGSTYNDIANLLGVSRSRAQGMVESGRRRAAE